MPVSMFSFPYVCLCFLSLTRMPVCSFPYRYVYVFFPLHVCLCFLSLTHMSTFSFSYKYSMFSFLYTHVYSFLSITSMSVFFLLQACLCFLSLTRTSMFSFTYRYVYVFFLLHACLCFFFSHFILHWVSHHLSFWFFLFQVMIDIPSLWILKYLILSRSRKHHAKCIR